MSIGAEDIARNHFLRTNEEGIKAARAEVDKAMDMAKLLLATFPGKTIQVIKVVRNLTGFGLKESKDIVDLVREMHPDLPQAPEYGRVFG